MKVSEMHKQKCKFVTFEASEIVLIVVELGYQKLEKKHAG